MNEEIKYESVKKSKKIVFIIWLLPFIALLISSIMVYKHFDEQGEEISIYFDNAEGLVSGKTPLKYKGIKIGVISSIEVDINNIDKFLVKISVHKQALDLVTRKGTMFWKVEPKATITEISGLNTILSGIYIEAMPKVKSVEEIKKLPKRYIFQASNEKPIDYFEEGLFLTLKSSKGSLEVGAPVLYKSFVVGKIVKKNLVKNDILYTIFIEDKYKSLVKQSSNFWNISGVDLKATLSGIRFKIDTLASLIAGGIQFDSNSQEEGLKNTKKVFELYDSKDEIAYLKDYLVLQSNQGHNLEVEFSKVFYNGIEIGFVDDLKYLPNEKIGYIFIKLKKEFSSILEYKPYFELVKPSFSLENIEGLSTLVKGNYIKVTKTTNKLSKVDDIYTLNDKSIAKSVYNIVLKTKDSINISENAPIYFKNIEVGKVKNKKLFKNSDELRVEAEIFKEYKYLVNDSSIFYAQSPIEINANIDNISFKTAPLNGFINSSIAFETPNLKTKRTINRFELFSSYKQMLEEKYLQQKAKRFTISLDDANLIATSNNIYFKGVEAGKVLSKIYNEKTSKIDVEIFVFENFANFINESTKFYALDSLNIDFSLSKLNINTQPLDRLVKGGISFITLNEEAKKVNKFYNFPFYKNLEEIYNEKRFNNDGLRIVVNAKRKSSLKENSPVFYRQLQIGVVEKYKLSKDGTNVQLQLYIDKEFKNLVRENSIFYNATAFGMKISLLGVKISTETLETLLTGGISLVTPTQYKQRAKQMSKFPLYDDVQEEWLQWNPKFEKL
ncbi:hypothetical protein CP985_12315 [Malaciobacter mytili LMG 24559]|uniref:Mce/MlaD domain-containing protein n=1 Tax=Malaciobacter mytili LMG 24559 TaxID=1032238 RepID=A0AAX2AFT4_9BACT|nr:MlaD family protein [Malaciobacter mytili]AXH15447.1 paraquat-inducible protein B [Malaciobacter mytili LMG 24559]RXK14743.1 hypothetical protein CP985_12315 [Malaciobacter mytili LMG 24559]